MFLEFNLTIAVMVIFVSFIYFYQLILRRRSQIWAEERKEYDSLLNKVIQEGLGSIKEIILSFKENFFIKKLIHYLNRNSIVSIRAQNGIRDSEAVNGIYGYCKFCCYIFCTNLLWI